MDYWWMKLDYTLACCNNLNKNFLPNYTLKKDANKKIMLVIIAIIALISSTIIANYYSNIITANH